MLATVAVPTYRRPGCLARCLSALEGQTETPSEVLVVARDVDVETQRLLADLRSSLTIRIVTVTAGGLVAALNSALEVARGDIIAITDDDAAPRADWLSRIAAHYRDDTRIGGVGGRDVVHPFTAKAASTVGKVQWFGRVIGNHHNGVGDPRYVEILKGVNMSFRRAAIDGIKFDERLRGGGAQVHNDMAMSLAVRRRGWTLVYDPAITVDHYPAERFGEDQRGRFDPRAVANAAHNETLILLEYLGPLRRAAFLAWAFLVGTRSVPGAAQLVRFSVYDRRLTLQWFQASMKGRLDGYRTWRSTMALTRPRWAKPVTRS